MSDMTCTASVLGFPQVLPQAESNKKLLQSARLVPIEHLLLNFLINVIEDFNPHYIMVVERKGTAILRALKELPEDLRLNWPWKKVISSNEIKHLPPDLFTKKRVLIFDDMMRGGSHIKTLLEDFDEKGFWKSKDVDIKIAVFALNEKVRRGILFDGILIPHYWFYRNLTQDSYRSVRIQIVEMLQKAGSLLLDTEHIEVRVRLHCSFSRFIDFLKRKAEVIVFNSPANRTNITILYPDDEAHKLNEDLFPPGTDTKNIVKKCRIVQREAGEYAIIPICYPSIAKPDDSNNWPTDAGVERLLCKDINTPIARFYAVGLLAALDVLNWVLKDIATLKDTEYTMTLPTAIDEAKACGGYCLEHLNVVYPKINLKELNLKIANIAMKAKSKGKHLQKKWKPVSNNSISYRPSDMYKWAIQLLQIIRHVLDQRVMAMELYDSDGNCTKHPFGLRACEIFEIGKSLRFDNIIISALFDILIDEAYIITHVSKLGDKKQLQRVVRTFEPDGEVVSELINRYTKQWGMPNGW